jgi:hypothetical protein
MKKYLSVILICILCINAFAQDSMAWQKVCLGKNISHAQIVINSKDELFVIGIFKDSMELQGQKIYHNDNNSRGLFIVKFNTFNQLKWIKKVGGIFSSHGLTGCKIDNEDNIVFVINNIFEAKLYNVDKDTAKFYSLREGSLLLKYSGNGDFMFGMPLFSKYGFRHGIGYGGNQGIAIDKNNNINICGVLVHQQNFNDTIYLGNAMIIIDKICMFYAQITPNGKLNWVNTLNNSSGNSQGLDLAIDDDNNCLLTGILNVQDSAIVEGVKIVNQNKYTYNIIFKTNSSGVIQWVKYYYTKSYNTYIHQLIFNPISNTFFGKIYGEDIKFLNSDSLIGNQVFIQEIDKNGDWKSRIYADTVLNNMICTNKNGDIVIDGVTIYNRLGKKLLRKSYNNGDYNGHFDMDINSKNEIYLIGSTNYKKVNFDTVIISNNVPKRNEFYIVKLSKLPTISEQQFNFTIYPNPAAQLINILSETVLVKTVSIIDMNGKKVKEEKNAKNKASFEIDISSLPIGVYFVNAISIDKLSSQTLVVK